MRYCTIPYIYVCAWAYAAADVRRKRADFTGLTISARHAITTPLILSNVINTYIAHAN